jgi:hypothetical protein
MDFKTLRLVALLGASSLVASAAFAAGGVTPKGKKEVKVLQKSQKGAAELGVLKVGEEAEAIERAGMFWKVKFKGKEGYISILEVNRQADGGDTGLSKAIRNAAQESRGQDENSGVRARSAVMGVRGLDEGDQSAGAGTASPNLRMVYSMEDLPVTKSDVEKLGEDVFKEVEERAEKGE